MGEWYLECKDQSVEDMDHPRVQEVREGSKGLKGALILSKEARLGLEVDGRSPEDERTC